MPKKKQNTLAVTKSTTYYVVRVVQRLSLLFAASSTILLWAVLASLSHG